MSEPNDTMDTVASAIAEASPSETTRRFAFRGTEALVRASAFDGYPAPDRGTMAGASPWEAPGDELLAVALDSSAAPLPEPGDSLTVPGGALAASYPAETDAPDGWEWKPFRALINALPEPLWLPAARAMAYANWRASSRFCGRCGSPNGDKPDEIARLCPVCGALSFPRLSPAVLAAVHKDDRLLLARNALNRTGAWSILAGFVEPGESFEGCVGREVMEEVGIVVRTTGYRGSQPWPFPDQLMVGFTAEWVSGELTPDGVEIAEAGWFGPDDHPPLPMRGSLSRRLIEAAFEDIRTAGTRR